MQRPRRTHRDSNGSERLARVEGSRKGAVLGEMGRGTGSEPAGEALLTATFVVKGQPRPWKAPLRGKAGIWYSPKEMREYQRTVHHAVYTQMREQGLLGSWPLDARKYVMSVDAYFRNALFCDITNLRKNLEDSLQGLLYDNDRTVDHGPGNRYHDPSNPRVEIAISVVEL